MCELGRRMIIKGTTSTSTVAVRVVDCNSNFLGKIHFEDDRTNNGEPGKALISSSKWDHRNWAHLGNITLGINLAHTSWGFADSETATDLRLAMCLRLCNQIPCSAEVYGHSTYNRIIQL
jgi:hypothetical protein